MTTSLYQSVGAVDAVEWARVLCGCRIQDDWVEQWVCITFCAKLEHSSAETIDMIRKAAAMGNWWLAALLWQCGRSCITSRADFFVKHLITQVTQPPPYSPDLVPCDFWLFPKLKSPLKGKRFQENMMGHLMGIRRTEWGPKVAALKGTEVSLSCVQCFLYLLQ